jgi:bifunctional non-homologous end joining protein LigD
LQFVVQQHLARRLHWDLRLEWEGVLLSWAVPNGPSLDIADKQLAVETENHPLEYGDFEGVIPAGNYGAGAMIVWDRGRWLPREDLEEGFRKGKLLFELHGYKLHGLWTLVRLKKEPKNWLLIKERDAWMKPGAPPFDPRSVLSGLTVEGLRDRASAADHEAGQETSPAAALHAELERLRAPRRKVDGAKVELMLAEPRRQPFSRAGWIFEIKVDGYRALAERTPAKESAVLGGVTGSAPGPRHSASRAVEPGVGKLWYRSGREAARVFPEIARTVAALPFEHVLLDGEIAALDERGRPSFQLLQRRGQLQRAGDIARAAIAQPAAYFAFDLLALDGFDLRGLPLVERKRLLREVLPTSGALRFADHIDQEGEALFREIRRLGVEGVVGKRADSAYRSGRHADWLKVRADHEEDFAVAGYTQPAGSRAGFGALHLAARSGQRWLYMGRAGSGFTEKQLREIVATLENSRRATPPCENVVDAGKDDVWVEPKLVAVVRYVEATEGGQLRQPVFLRLRDDKRPEDCAVPADIGEVRWLGDAGAGANGADPDATPTTKPAPSAPRSARPASSPIRFSNLDKIFWPAEGITKGDLIDYYRGIAPWLLPYLADRPLVLDRYPDGIEGKSFFQKNAPAGTPDWVRTVAIADEQSGRETDHFICNDLETLLHIANSAAIPLHVWASRLASLQLPDWSIVDLDPKGAPFSDVVRLARAIHELCDDIGLDAVIKTSGSSGLHVLIPLGAEHGFEAARQLALLLSMVIAHHHPEIATVERTLAARGGRVYLDAFQNGAGKLLVSPLCARPVPGARVSMPLRWSEVGARLDPTKFTIRSARARLEKLGEDPCRRVLGPAADLAGALARLGERLTR